MIKVIFMTMAATSVVITLVVSIFMNSILGVFGLATTTIESLNSIAETKQIIDTMKMRNKNQRLNVSKRFAKRSGKKIAMSAASAATIGRAAVVVTVAVLETYDYCEDKKELQEDENILFKVNKEFNLDECLNEAMRDSDEIIISVKNTVPDVVGNAWGSTIILSNETWVSAMEFSESTWDSTKGATKKIWNSMIGRVE